MPRGVPLVAVGLEGAGGEAIAGGTGADQQQRVAPDARAAVQALAREARQVGLDRERLAEAVHDDDVVAAAVHLEELDLHPRIMRCHGLHGKTMANRRDLRGKGAGDPARPSKTRP